MGRLSETSGADLYDGLYVPGEAPEPGGDVGQLELGGPLQELVKKLLVLAVEDGLLCAVVDVEDLEEDDEDDGDDDEVEHVAPSPTA